MTIRVFVEPEIFNDILDFKILNDFHSEIIWKIKTILKSFKKNNEQSLTNFCKLYINSL